jgi:hypothetical protein
VDVVVGRVARDDEFEVRHPDGGRVLRVGEPCLNELDLVAFQF